MFFITTYGDVRKNTLAILDEYSSAGNVQTTADVLVKIQQFTNKAYRLLSTTVDKVPNTYTINRDAEDDPTEFDLPSDWLEKNYAMISYSDNEPLYFNDYTIHVNRKIKVSKYLYPVDITFYYWKHIVPLTFTGVEVTDDAQTFEISEQGVEAIPYFAAGNILISEGDTSKGYSLLNIYQGQIAQIKGVDYGISDTVLNLTGW